MGRRRRGGALAAGKAIWHTIREYRKSRLAASWLARIGSQSAVWVGEKVVVVLDGLVGLFFCVGAFVNPAESGPYVVCWLFLQGVVLALLVEVLLLPLRRLRLAAWSPARPRSPDQWAAAVTDGDPHRQWLLFDPFALGELRLDAAGLLRLLERFEAAVRQEPAASRYWRARHTLEETVRQERRTCAAVDVPAGESVYSQDQWDAGGEVVAKVVEEVFERYAGVLHLHAGGQVIRTTHEHPFFVLGKGWTPANELHVGDRLVCAANGKTVTVESVTDTGEWELVYNLRVAECHTYFVGGDDWGFEVWAHNTYSEVLRKAFRMEVGKVWKTRPIGDRPADVSKWASKWWATWGMLHTPTPDPIKFAFGVANSFRRGGVSAAQANSVFGVICGFPQDMIQAAIEDAYTPIIRRDRLVGSTPGRLTDVGLAVRARMADLDNRAVPGQKWAYVDQAGQWWVYSIRPQGAGATVPASAYYKWEQCEMGHHPLDAVVWWDQVGKTLPRTPSGGPGPEIVAWMNNPDHYQLQLKSHNASAGARFAATGPWWVPPVSP